MEESREKITKYIAEHPPNAELPAPVTGYPFEINGIPIAWIKFRGDWRIQEAYTQEFVRVLLLNETSPSFSAIARVPKVYMAFRSGGAGIIVMEYIRGTNCTVSDAERIAIVLRTLLAVPLSPSSFLPGPIERSSNDRAPIRHIFFGGEEARVAYDSAEELEMHANRVSSYVQHRLLVWFRHRADPWERLDSQAFRGK